MQRIGLIHSFDLCFYFVSLLDLVIVQTLQALTKNVTKNINIHNTKTYTNMNVK
jgi:hypothetical protein